MDHTKSRRLALVILLLSLAWNGGVIILLLCIQDDVHLQNPFSVTLQEDKENNESPQKESLPKKKDSSSTFFVTQLISNGTSPLATTIIPQPITASPSLQKASPIPVPQQSIEQNMQPQQDLQEKTATEPAQDLNENEADAKEETAEINQPSAQSEEHSDPSKNKQENNKIEEESLTYKRNSETMFADQANTTQKEAQCKNLALGSHKTHPLSKPRKKKTVGLADIAQGYMKHVATEREHTVEHQLQSLPSNKQMAMHVYATKIFALLEQAARVNQKLLYAPENHTTDATLMLTIDKGGQLLEVHLVPTLHEKEIREWLFKFINHVGLFPPIPKHLNQDKLTLSYPLRIDMKEGFGTYSLYYGFANRY